MYYINTRNKETRRDSIATCVTLIVFFSSFCIVRTSVDVLLFLGLDSLAPNCFVGPSLSARDEDMGQYALSLTSHTRFPLTIARQSIGVVVYR